MSEKSEIKRVAKADRPPFYPDEPAAEKILAMVTALATEVAVLRERQDTFERLAEDKGYVLASEIESYEPSDDVAARRRQWRDAYLDRVFHVLLDDVDSLADAPATS